jgi:hypothetical protein
VLKKWAKDKSEDVREKVAENPNCPADVVVTLAEDEGYSVREGVARNVNCPWELLERLADDEEGAIKWHVVWNPNCPVEVLVKLLYDKHSDVRQVAAIKILNDHITNNTPVFDIQTYRKVLKIAPAIAGAFVAFDNRISDDLRWDLIKTCKRRPVLAFMALRDDLPNYIIEHLIHIDDATVNTLLLQRKDLTETQEVVTWL